MYDIETIQILRANIKDTLEKYKEDLIYGVDNMEKLQYARGKINALEVLLQDLNDLLKKDENIYKISRLALLSKFISKILRNILSKN